MPAPFVATELACGPVSCRRNPSRPRCGIPGRRASPSRVSPRSPEMAPRHGTSTPGPSAECALGRTLRQLTVDPLERPRPPGLQLLLKAKSVSTKGSTRSSSTRATSVLRHSRLWATLEDVPRADCEDIAIAKMWLLNAAGVDFSSMRLVVLKDTLRNLDHAVYTWSRTGTRYVLDNAAWKVGRADWMRLSADLCASARTRAGSMGCACPRFRRSRLPQSDNSQLPQ